MSDTSSKVKLFEESFCKLRKDRFRTMPKIKLWENKLLVLLREKEVLESLEERDKLLSDKLQSHEEERAKIVDTMEVQRRKLDHKKAELDLWIEKEKSLSAEFNDLVPHSSSSHHALKKIFLRKIKLNHDSDSEYEPDDDDFDEDEIWYSDEEEEDARPPDCSIQDFETVLSLREKRIRQEHELSIFRREVEQLKRAHERLSTKENRAYKDLQSVREEMRTFQSEKQRVLNEIDVVIPISLDQMYLWEESDMLSDRSGYLDSGFRTKVDVHMGNSVVFSSKAFSNLNKRIQDLEDIIKEHKQHFGFLQREKHLMAKEVTAKNQSICDEKKRCQELQMLKFGQLVDIEALDNAVEDHGTEQISNNIAGDGNNVESIMEEHKSDIRILQEEEWSLKLKLKDLTDKNTSLLKSISSLNEKQLAIEKTFSEKDQMSMIATIDEHIEKENIQEHESLKLKRKEQKGEIERLVGEINKLKRKDGHIYSSVEDM